eukprot:scaffold59291_cov74-Cyclotella_meneghiniana.AAC.2
MKAALNREMRRFVSLNSVAKEDGFHGDVENTLVNSEIFARAFEGYEIRKWSNRGEFESFYGKHKIFAGLHNL